MTDSTAFSLPFTQGNHKGSRFLLAPPPLRQKLHPYGDKRAAEPPALVLLFQTGERGEGKAKGKGQNAHASQLTNVVPFKKYFIEIQLI